MRLPGQRQEHGGAASKSSPDTDIAVNLPWPLATDWDGGIGFCSLRACWCHLVDVRLPVLFTAEARRGQKEQEFPGTNRCELRIITHPLTLQMSQGTKTRFYVGGKRIVLLVFKVGLEVVNIPCLCWSVFGVCLAGGVSYACFCLSWMCWEMWLWCCVSLTPFCLP